MGQSKLNNFILFHLFKWPAVLALAAAGGLLFSQQIKEQADGRRNLVRAKNEVDQAQLDKYWHLLNPSTTLVDFFQAHLLNRPGARHQCQGRFNRPAEDRNRPFYHAEAGELRDRMP
jgi:hypothetical protein